jgi:hypothetical protein
LRYKAQYEWSKCWAYIYRVLYSPRPTPSKHNVNLVPVLACKKQLLNQYRCATNYRCLETVHSRKVCVSQSSSSSLWSRLPSGPRKRTDGQLLPRSVRPKPQAMTRIDRSYFGRAPEARWYPMQCLDSFCSRRHHALRTKINGRSFAIIMRPIGFWAKEGYWNSRFMRASNICESHIMGPFRRILCRRARKFVHRLRS